MAGGVWRGAIWLVIALAATSAALVFLASTGQLDCGYLASLSPALAAVVIRGALRYCNPARRFGEAGLRGNLGG